MQSPFAQHLLTADQQESNTIKRINFSNQAATTSTSTTIKQYGKQISNKTLRKSFRNSELSKVQTVISHPKIQKGLVHQYQEYQNLQTKTPMQEKKEFKIINEEDMINEDSQTSRKNMDRITQGFLFDQKQKALKVNKDMNKEDVTHMNQLIVSMRKRLKSDKKDILHVQKQAIMYLQINPNQQFLNNMLSASNLATVDMSSVEDEDQCQECVHDKIVIRKQNQDLVDLEADQKFNIIVQQNDLQAMKDNLSNERYHEKQDNQVKSMNTSKSNASITYNDKNFQDAYDQKSFLNKEKLINIHRPYQLTVQKSSIKNKNQSEKNSKMISPTYEKQNTLNQHLSISQPKKKIEKNQRNQSNLEPQKLKNNLSYKNILGSDSRNFQTINTKYYEMRQKSDDSVKLTAGRKSYASKQIDNDSTEKQNDIVKDSKQIVNPNLDGDVEIVLLQKKMIQNIKNQNSSQSLGRISISDLKQNLRKIRMKNSQLNNYEQMNEFDKKNSILQFDKNKKSENSTLVYKQNQKGENQNYMQKLKYLNSSGLTFKVNQMETKESTHSITLPDINYKLNQKANQDYNESKQDYTQFLYGQTNQNHYATFDSKKQMKLPLKILQSIEKQNEQQNKSLSIFMKKRSIQKTFQQQSDKIENGIVQNYSNEISGSEIYDFTQKFISSGKDSRLLNESESKVKVPSIKRQLNKTYENDQNQNKQLPYSLHVSAQKNDLTTSDTELKSKTGNFSSLEDTIQMSKSDISKRQNFSKIQSKIGNSQIKALNEQGKKEISPYQNLSIVENQIDEQNYFTDKSYEQEQYQHKSKMISNFGTNLLQYNKLNSSDYNPHEQKQILIKSQKLNILIKKKQKNKEDENEKSQKMNSLNQSQVLKQSDLSENKMEIQESRKNLILNQIELFKQNIKKNSISQMSKEEIIVQSQIIKAQQKQAKTAVKNNSKTIIKDVRNKYSNNSLNQKQSKQQKVDLQKSNLKIEKNVDTKTGKLNEIKQKREFSQKSFIKDINQNIIKCDHCKKPKIKNPNQQNTRLKFQQSPIKYIKESKARSISENHKKNESEQNSNLQTKNKTIAEKLLLKSQEKRLSIESGTSPNLIRFLERNNSKDRLLLTKAYNISLQNQIEFQHKNSPQNRFFRLYVQDQQESQDGDSLSEQNKNLKKLKIKQKQHPLSPKTSRRMINALQPCYRKANDQLISRQEKEKKKIEDKIEKNTAEQNFHLFAINEGARQIILKRQDVCNCSQMHRNRMIDRSISIHSVNSVRTAILNRMRRRNKKQGYSEIHESAGEQQTDEGADEINRRTRLGQNQKHNPHRPCRRTCSTVHNPMFHPWRQGRVQSADHLRKKKRMELLKIDWQKTLMYKHINTSNLNNYIDIRQEESILKIKNKKVIDDDNDGLYSDEQMKRKINLKNQKLTSIFQEREQQIAKKLDKLDMKHLHSQIDQELLNEQKKQKVKSYSSKEIDYFYSLVKQEDMIDRDEDFIKSLILKSQNTLQMLMNSLMLKNEYDIIQASYQSKLNFKHNKVLDKKAQRLIQLEIIKKMLLRCRNFFEAKYEIVRILVKTAKRDNLINQFEQQMQDGILEASKAKNYYQIILKLSCRIFNQIEKIRVDNPMLNRPFIYQQANLQSHMIKQILNIRTNLKNNFEGLLPKTELDQILDKTGKIINISELSQINRELDSQDPFGSSIFELQSGKGFNRKKSKNEYKQSPNKREYDLDQRKIFIGLMRQNDGKLQSQRVQLVKQQENIASNLFNNNYEVNSANSCKVNKNILK